MFTALSRLALPALLLLAPTALAAPTVQLLEAGEGAQQTVRFTPKLGAKGTLTATLDFDMAMEMGGDTPQAGNLPPAKYTLAHEVAEVRDDGHAVLRFTVQAAEVTEPDLSKFTDDEKQGMKRLIEQARPELARLVGSTGELVVDAHGATVSLDVAPPPGAVQGKQLLNLLKALRHSRPVFPSEPIGLGARWTVTDDVRESGLNLTEITTYELASQDGGAYVLTTSLTQKANGHQVTDKLPPGTQADLIALASDGTGQLTVRPTHLFPSQGQLTHDLQARVLIASQQRVMEMGIQLHLDLTVSDR